MYMAKRRPWAKYQDTWHKFPDHQVNQLLAKHSGKTRLSDSFGRFLSSGEGCYAECPDRRSWWFCAACSVLLVLRIHPGSKTSPQISSGLLEIFYSVDFFPSTNWPVIWPRDWGRTMFPAKGRLFQKELLCSQVLKISGEHCWAPVHSIHSLWSQELLDLKLWIGI